MRKKFTSAADSFNLVLVLFCLNVCIGKFVLKDLPMTTINSISPKDKSFDLPNLFILIYRAEKSVDLEPEALK